MIGRTGNLHVASVVMLIKQELELVIMQMVVKTAPPLGKKMVAQDMRREIRNADHLVQVIGSKLGT